MPDPHGTRSLGTAPKLAIGAAVVALFMSVLAVIVVVTRDGSRDGSREDGGTVSAPPDASSGSASTAAKAGAGAGAGAGAAKAGADDPALPPARRVAAADVMRLRRDAVALVRDAGRSVGVRVTDEELRKALDLGPDDVITAISGRSIEREFDVFEAIFSVRSLRASTVYVDLLRDGQPVLARWKVDGDLRTARLPDPSGTRGVLGSLGGGLGGLGGLGGGSGTGGSLGGTGGSLGGNPFLPVPTDPLIDTIKRIDDLHYEVPRSTIQRVLASRSAYAGIARALTARRTTGLQLFGVRPGTLLTAVGIASGDIVRAINANAVTSVDEVIDLLPQIQGDKEWRVDLDRRGKPVLLTIAIK
jgi:S1-C subfamily serine protease